jgi:energy-coupling factor transporter ATP-binding protein EcfA2
MYEHFFEMRYTPFTRDLPPERLYESPYVADALGRLTYAADRQLFAVVTADAGCGKSTLIRSFVSALPKEEYIFLYLSDSKLTPRWFYKGLLDQLGMESKFYRGDAKRQLQKEVEIIQGVQKKKVVCILDELCGSPHNSSTIIKSTPNASNEIRSSFLLSSDCDFNCSCNFFFCDSICFTVHFFPFLDFISSM